MDNLRRRLSFGLVLGFLVFVVLAVVGDIERVGTELVGFAWELVPLILACTLFNYLLLPRFGRCWRRVHQRKRSYFCGWISARRYAG